ncbi:MAG: chemotaxis protein CheX, partial [Terriglobales bacterium]
MKMELIQPFINAADAVLAETLKCSTKIGDVNMEEEVYRRKGMAALIGIHGDIEGRVILDIDSSTAAAIASALTGSEVSEKDEVVKEAIFELANLVIGNAVT